MPSRKCRLTPTPHVWTTHSDFLLKSAVWRGVQYGKIILQSRSDKHQLSQGIKVSINSHIMFVACTLNVMKMVFYLWSFPPQIIEAHSNNEENISKLQSRDILQNTLPVLLKTVKKVTDKGSLKNCHNHLKSIQIKILEHTHTKKNIRKKLQKSEWSMGFSY